MKLLRKLLCLIGLHSMVHKEKWTPSKFAPIVTEFEFTTLCKHCPKTLGHTHWKWDGEEMVDVNSKESHDH